MAVQCTVGGDDSTSVAVLSGDLDVRDVASLRTRLLKCLAEQPAALLVDLTALTVIDPLALTVFSAVARQAGQWPGIPLVLCAPAPEVASMLAGGALRHLTVFADETHARLHLMGGRATPPVISEMLLPIKGSARHARNVVTDACLRWDLPHLVAPASLITSELVSNVIDHVSTLMTMRVSLRPRFLTIAVRDGSAEEPSSPGPVTADTTGGRGLFLVAATAHSWGFLPTDDGKVVWASLDRTALPPVR